jgi:hypothetical protein
MWCVGVVVEQRLTSLHVGGSIGPRGDAPLIGGHAAMRRLVTRALRRALSRPRTGIPVRQYKL